MADKITPEQLLKFFSSLDPGDAGADDEVEIHYGSPTVLKRGLLAAKMLMDVQQALGVKAGAAAEAAPAEPPRPKAEVKEMPPDQTQKMKATTDALAEAESEADRLLLQNVDLKKENELLKERVKRLQRQVERLYNKSELTSLLGRLNTPGPEDRPAAADGLQTPEAKAPEAKAPEPAPTPAATPLPATAAPKEGTSSITTEDGEFHLAELADASRVPKEELEAKAADSAAATNPEPTAK